MPGSALQSLDTPEQRLVRAPARLKNTCETRRRLRPLSSNAAMVLSKSGSAGSPATASISRRCSASALSKAGRKCSGAMAVAAACIDRLLIAHGLGCCRSLRRGIGPGVPLLKADVCGNFGVIRAHGPGGVFLRRTGPRPRQAGTLCRPSH
jgi:hypothetical protein